MSIIEKSNTETTFKNQSKYIIIESIDEIKKDTCNLFMISDIICTMNEHSIYKPILSIEINEGTEEYKKKYLDEIISKFSKDYIICTASYASMNEFPASKYYLRVREPEKGKELLPIKEILDRERKILEEKGFISINSYVAYECKEAFIYLNNEGKILASYMNQQGEDHEH